MARPILRALALRKEFGGRPAVDGVSFDVAAGEIVGLLGPNGAGKTTTISMVLGVLEPSAGSVEISGVDLARHRSQALERVNFAASYASLPGNLSVEQNLRVFGRLYGVKDLSARIDAVLEELDLKRFRRAKAGVPEEIAFQTKPEIALEQIRAAVEAGLPRGVALMDAGYGKDTEFRTGVSALGLPYVAAVLSNTTVWPQGTGPLPPKPWSGRERPLTRLRRDALHQPISAEALAFGLPEAAWTVISWREGTNGELASRFARTRVRAAHGDRQLSAPRDEEWLLIEWPEGEAEPTKYWLSTVPEETGFEQLVDLTQLRWRIERDYQELKQELGLGHYEGRGWRGFHHHATLCIAAYGLLIAERARLSPSGGCGRGRFEAPRLPTGYRPRGAADPTRTAPSQLDGHRATPPHGGARPKSPAMPVLCAHQPEPTRISPQLMTQ